MDEITASIKMNSDSEEEENSREIGYAASDGDFELVKAWLAGGSASDPRSVNASDGAPGGHFSLHRGERDLTTPEHVEFARYLISQGSQARRTE